jgi:hypothetical protein
VPPSCFLYQQKEYSLPLTISTPFDDTSLLVWDEQDHYYKPEEETAWLPFLSLETRSTFNLRQTV